jgi:2-C-methyl-D-erythritol 4-phosphate cytidylyltransferase/2-C-methyl-D-erythritol 2,4-cyclodiphosphate synthase
MFVTAIIAAGGRGIRFGGAVPKQLLAIDGRTLLERSVEAFLSHPAVDELVVALPSEFAGGMPAYLRSSGKPLRTVTGGPRRQDSVSNAFTAVAAASDVILIHDAARPFVSADVISRTIEAAVLHGAAIAAVQASDTVKRVRPVVSSPSADPLSCGSQPGGLESAGSSPAALPVVLETLDRETIFLAQTPQGFRRDVLAAAVALGQSGVEATDEASLAERAGYAVHVVAGDPHNIKITRPEDLDALRDGRRAAVRSGRAGLGYDLHRLVEGRTLVLGGVTIPAERGALGHSDADVVCHAATDAILGAACLGDIGQHFPDTDPRWKGARSLDLLRQAAAMAAEQGFEIGNLDVTVMLEVPKLRGYIDRIRASLAAALGIEAGRISVKAKTNEGVDAIGRGEAIAAQAIALLRRRT